MKDSWTPFFLLPNIQLKEAIGCDIAAIAPADDDRVAALKDAHPEFRQFLGRFTDAFSEKFQPSVLLLRATAPDAFREVEALAGFRDAIALATITRSRARSLNSGGRPAGGASWGEAFAIYPWSFSRNYENLIGNSPAMLGLQGLVQFRGQSSPALPRTEVSETDVDRPLLDALLSRWQRRHEAVSPIWEDLALMRSLTWPITPHSCRPGRRRRTMTAAAWLRSGSAPAKFSFIPARVERLIWAR
jgi:hypothetical protein